MREEQIRPAALFQDFLRLTAWDSENFFDKKSFVSVGCPICSGTIEKTKPLFTKFGFKYSECETCKSWFASYRPHSNAIARWYSDSPGARFWATNFYPATAEARRKLIWAPKAQNLAEVFGSLLGPTYSLVDIGGGFGIFADEFRLVSGTPVTVVEPGFQLARRCAAEGIPVIPKFLEEVTEEDLPVGNKAFVCFELFEHLAEPEPFFRHLKSLMKRDDIAYFTTLSGNGLDIRELQSHSDAVSPPHHLLLANPASVTSFLNRLDFELLEVTTPGNLDIDILFRKIGYLSEGFLRDFLTVATEPQRNRLQELVSATGLSSHMAFKFRLKV